jgi:hypothetical protein
MAKRRKHKRLRGLQFASRKFRSHATALGQLIFTWNDLHEQLALIYWTLCDHDDGALDKWSRPPSDKQKRELIRRRANKFSPSAKNMWDDIVWLLDAIDDFTDFRNDAAHAPVTIEPESFLSRRDNFTAGVISNSSWRNRRARNLIRKDLLAEYRWQRNVLTKLRDYALTIERSLVDDYTPWPKRPNWPDRPKPAKPLELPLFGAGSFATGLFN